MADFISPPRRPAQMPEHIPQPAGVAFTDLVLPLRMREHKSEAVEYYREVALEVVNDRATLRDLAEACSFLTRIECACVVGELTARGEPETAFTENLRGRTLFQVCHELDEGQTQLREEVRSISEGLARITDARTHEQIQLNERLTRIASEQTSTLLRQDNRISGFAGHDTQRYNELRASNNALRQEIIGQIIAMERRVNELAQGLTQIREQFLIFDRRHNLLVEGQTQVREQLSVTDRRMDEFREGQNQAREGMSVMDRRINELAGWHTRMSEQMFVTDRRINELVDGQTRMREEFTAQLTTLEINIRETLLTSVAHSCQEALNALHRQRRA